MLLFIFLAKQTSKSMQLRLKLTGVAFWQQQLARIFSTFVVVFSISGTLFVIGLSQLSIQYFALDYMRILLFVGLLVILTILVCAIVDVVIYFEKAKLLVAFALCVLLIAVSGAIFPTIYFPYSMQPFFPYFYPFDIWKWLTELIFEERNYASYSKSCVMLFGALVLYSAVLYVRGRMTR